MKWLLIASPIIVCIAVYYLIKACIAIDEAYLPPPKDSFTQKPADVIQFGPRPRRHN